MECRHFLLFTVILIAFSSSISAKHNIIVLNEDNWHQMLQDEWMVEFYAPWCPACKALTPTWKLFSEWSRELGIRVGQVDVTTSPGLSGRFMVTALPTIFHVVNGEFRQYRGTRDKNAFMSFVEDKKWKTIEPISRWKAPDSVQMSIVASFFKLSQVLRGFHNQLMVEYGLPTWGSYLIFAIATIFLGALLGLVLVCVIDFIYPAKPVGKASTSADQANAAGDTKPGQHELDDEDIKDDLVDDGSQSDKEKNSDTEQSEDEPRSPPAAGEPGTPSVRKRKARRAD